MTAFTLNKESLNLRPPGDTSIEQSVALPSRDQTLDSTLLLQLFLSVVIFRWSDKNSISRVRREMNHFSTAAPLNVTPRDTSVFASHDLTSGSRGQNRQKWNTTETECRIICSNTRKWIWWQRLHMTKHGDKGGIWWKSCTAVAPLLNMTKSDTVSLTLSIHQMVVNLALKNSSKCYLIAGSCQNQCHVVYDPVLARNVRPKLISGWISLGVVFNFDTVWHFHSADVTWLLAFVTDSIFLRQHKSIFYHTVVKLWWLCQIASKDF